MDQLIAAVIGWAALPVGLYAFVHAISQRADAFTAVGKLTKPAWLGITGAGSAAILIAHSALSIFWIAGVVAVLVYIVDVRPKVTEIQQ